MGIFDDIAKGLKNVDWKKAAESLNKTMVEVKSKTSCSNCIYKDSCSDYDSSFFDENERTAKNCQDFVNKW